MTGGRRRALWLHYLVGNGVLAREERVVPACQPPQHRQPARRDAPRKLSDGILGLLISSMPGKIGDRVAT